ncbi:MAG: OmpA family protein [Flavobacteriales bacterium]|nr:OmpA family protein [Flavobacteriales bacterium]
MNNISLNKTLIALAFMFISVSAFAQTAEQQQTKRGPYITNGFWDNWFISAGAGAQMYFTEGFNSIGKKSERISPAFDLSVGKWITPIYGARIQVAGLTAKGFTNDASNPFIEAPRLGQTHDFKTKMNYLHYHVDFMLNLSAAIGGYKANRVYEIIPYVGFGGISATNEQSNSFAFNAGLFNKFRVSKAIDINIDIKGTLLDSKFDYNKSRMFDGIGAVTAGITYHFPNRTFKRASELTKEDLTPFNNRIKGLEDDLAAANAKNKALADELAAEKNKPAQVVEGQAAPLAPLATFFPIGQTTLTAKEKVNLDAVAQIIKANPDKKYVVKGYADKQTGSATRNMQLSKQRAQNVADYLVSKGVNKSQLDVKGLGSTASPYATASLNRVAVVEE